MRILVIDDMREFKSPPEDAAVVYARTSKEGLNTLKHDKNWNQIYLDHDLGYNFHGCLDHIGPVLSYIEEHTDDFDTRTQFFVITSNPYAGNMMTRSLSVCGLKVARLDPYRQFHYVW